MHYMVERGKRREKEKKKERMWEEEASSGLAKGRDSARLRHLLRPARPRRVKKRHQWPLRQGLLTSRLTSSRRKRWILECHGTTAQKHHQWLCSRDGMGLHLRTFTSRTTTRSTWTTSTGPTTWSTRPTTRATTWTSRRRTSRCWRRATKSRSGHWTCGQHGTTSRSGCCR